MTRNRPAWLILALALTAPTTTGARADEPSPDVTEPPPFERFVVIPLRVHVLTADDLPETDCALADGDIERILAKVNAIWHRSGVHWALESIVREPAAHQDRFRMARDLNGRAPLGLFRVLIPEESRKVAGLHVYYVHKLPVNGVYMGGDFAIVQETARLREVEGGIDEPIPRVTAHELGHALGLEHRQDRTNLLASGTTGTLLNAREVETARARALKINGASTVADLRESAAEAASRGETARARRLWSWLAEVPGDGAAEAKRKLDELKDRADQELDR